jgi:hypothetical protein
MALPLAMTATAALAVPLTAHAATATSSAGTASAAAARSVSSRLQPGSSALTTLITGDRVHLTSRTGAPSTPEVIPATTSGPGRVLQTRVLNGDTYVIPAVAAHYLDHQLSPSLFDVTAQQKAQPASGATSGRVDVSLHYTGTAKPSVPGVTVGQASGGTATGYLTASGARTFGQALTAQWKADRKAGFPSRASLFTGSSVTAIAPAVAAPGVAQPNFPMYTLVVKATDLTGKPIASAFAAIINVDDARKYSYFADIENGEARISVPAGNYSAVTDTFDYDETTNVATFHMATVNQYKVSGAGQTLSIAFKGTYVQAGAYSAPKPSTAVGIDVDWSRSDAAGYGSLGWGYGIDSTDHLYVQPSPKPTIGKVAFTESWQAAAPGSSLDKVTGYTLDLAAYWDHIPTAIKATFTSASLATVNSTYDADRAALNSAFGRFAIYPDAAGGGWLLPLTAPTTRSEYVGAIGGGGVLWQEEEIFNDDSFDDPGFIDGPFRSIPPGSVSPITWGKGPFGAKVPVQKASSNLYAFCYTCQSGNELTLIVPPWGDSDPTHTGELFGEESGTPVAQFHLYRNGTLINADAIDDYFGADVVVPSGSATYKAQLDVDRRLQDPKESTKSTTVLTFKSATGQGGTLPANWVCELDPASSCRVLPILQARAVLPLSKTGTLPAGKSAVSVVAGRVQNALGASVTSATLSFRVSGSTTAWTKVPLAETGDGTFKGTLNNAGLAGKSVDIKVTAADDGGSTWSQTVLKAYTVAGA